MVVVVSLKQKCQLAAAFQHRLFLFFTSFKRALHPLCFKLQTKKPGENLARAVHSREARRNHDKRQGTWGAEKCTVDKTFQQGPVNLSGWPPFLRATRQQRLVPQDDDLHLVSLSSPLVFYESCVTVVVFRVQFNLCLVCFADSFSHRIFGFLQGLTIIEYHVKASFFQQFTIEPTLLPLPWNSRRSRWPH